MTVRKIDIAIKFETKSNDEARIIYNSLSPDNYANPPVEITSKFVDEFLEVNVKGLSNINTANATITDILDSYDLNEQVIKKIEKSI